MEDGIYLEVFCIKSGKRYNVKTVSARHLCTTIAEAVVAGFGEVIEYEDGKKEDEFESWARSGSRGIDHDDLGRRFNDDVH